MQQPSGRGPGLIEWLAMLSFAAAGACTRASAPPPAADAAPSSTPSIAAEPEPAPVAPTPSPVATPREAPPVASAPHSAAAAPASPDPWTTPHDCSKVEASVSQRARALATCNAKEEFRSFVAARQSCKVASDCSVIPGACPFGCFVPARKAAVSEVTAKLNELGARLDQAGDRCMYRCMAPPPEVCVEGRCSTGAL